MAGRALALAAVLGAAVLLLASCGDDGSEAEEPTPTPTAVRTSPPPATPTAVPTPTPIPPDAPRDISYRVEPGDTLGSIAEQFGVTVESIMEANGLTDETSLAIEQILVIKGVDPSLVGAAPVESPTTESPIGIRMTMPLAGACLPKDDGQMPNSPREYRNGTHEGVDFFTGFACIDVPIGLDVLAPYDGVVIRSDQEYKQLTQKQIDDLLALAAAQGYTDPGTLDKLRGRQIWVDHGDGITTRYAHLSDIPPDMQVGRRVRQGQPIAFVGDSGTPESLGQEGYNKHLHFEIRVGDKYLAEGLPPEETRAQYEAVFGLR